MKNSLKILLFIFICNLLFAQSDQSRLLLNKVKNKLDKVNDYSADILVKIDVNFLKVKDTKAHVFFKKPDKFKLDAPGFALIPKASVNFLPLNLLNQKFLSLYIKQDTLASRQTDVIKLIPTNSNSNIVLATLWVDRQDAVIKKIEATTNGNGTFTIILEYGSQVKYGLPHSASFSFNVAKSNFPHFPFAEKSGRKSLRKALKKPMIGKVKIFYSNYKINSGLNDSLFERKTKKEFN